MIVVWIVAVWLLSLAVFVALRAHGTRHAAGPPRRPHQAERSPSLPSQRAATADDAGKADETGGSSQRMTGRR
jgi:hypothetical protein